MNILDPTIAGILKDVKEKFGDGAGYVATDHSASLSVVRVPLPWAWFIGGIDGVPIGRCLGCDAPPAHFKSVLAWEHLRWFLLENGIGVYIDNEEKTSDSFMRSLMSGLDFMAHCRLIYLKSQSTEDWQNYVTFFMKKADELKSAPPAKRHPVCVVVDSLTGLTTESQQEAVRKEGAAPARGYPEMAMAISKFYDSLVFGDRFLSLMHVQHAKKNMDPDAAGGDDEYIAKGGSSPRFKASYHYRVLSHADVECAEYRGRELTVRMVKAGFGESRRVLKVRVLWKNVTVEVPVWEDANDTGEGNAPRLQDAEVPMDKAVTYFEGVFGHLAQYQVRQLYLAMGIDSWYSFKTKVAEIEAQKAFAESDKELKKLDAEIDAAAKTVAKSARLPVTTPQKCQVTWVDWGYSLAQLLIDQKKYSKYTYAAEKKELEEALEFTNSGCNKGYIKCETVFGDTEPHTYSAFGDAIMANPEIAKRIKTFLAIRPYKSFRDVQVEEVKQARAKKEKKK